MTLHWTTTALNNIAGGSDQATTGAPQTLHSSECLQADTETVKLAMEACLDKALSFLDQNVNDDSLFFLCEWNMKSCELSIVVTDETKSVDSPHRINCIFTGLATSSESSANDTEALSELSLIHI